MHIIIERLMSGNPEMLLNVQEADTLITRGFVQGLDLEDRALVVARLKFRLSIVDSLSRQFPMYDSDRFRWQRILDRVKAFEPETVKVEDAAIYGCMSGAPDKSEVLV